MADLEELRRRFLQVQDLKTHTKVSEILCVDILQQIIDHGMLKVVFTLDGKVRF